MSEQEWHQFRNEFNALSTNVAVLAEKAQRADDHDARIRALEIDTANNKLVVNSVRWLAATVVASAVSVVVAAILGGLFTFGEVATKQSNPTVYSLVARG